MPKNTLTDRDIELLLRNDGDLSELFDRCARNPELLNDVILFTDVAHGIVNPDTVRDNWHPEPALLARYHLSRASLEDLDQTRIAQHLGECADCAMDLQALANFDFTKLPRSAAATRIPPVRQSLLATLAALLPESIGFRYGLASAVSLVAGALIAVFVLRPAESIHLRIDSNSELAGARSAIVRVALPGGDELQPEGSLAEVCPGGQLICSCAR